MLLNLKKEIDKHSLNIRGVIHVGAHFGQEYEEYKSNGIEHIVFIEPCQGAFTHLHDKFSNHSDVKLFNTACGETEMKAVMNVETANNGMSNSILEPKLHLRLHPEIKFNGKETVNVVPLDTLDLNGDYNMLYMDVQGYELNVLKGSNDTLKGIDCIMTEVNRDEVYRDCARIEDLDDFLFPLGFTRVDTLWWNNSSWGDALYVRKKEAETADNKIITVPKEFQTPIKPPYPPDNTQIFEEYYFQNVSESDHGNDSRCYLPVFFTGYYVNNKYGNDKEAIKRLQGFIDSLDTTKKYYTIVQYDDGILNDVSKLDLKVFSMTGGKDSYPLPLICTPHKLKPKENLHRRYLFNFIGRETHVLRKKILQLRNKDYYISSKNHSIESYCNIINDSVFTLCPRGYGKTSFRIQEALQYGSIPVYISDEFILPHNIDFIRYGILVKPEEVKQLPEILQEIPRDFIRVLQEEGKKIYSEYFTYSQNKEIIIKELIKESFT